MSVNDSSEAGGKYAAAMTKKLTKADLRRGERIRSVRGDLSQEKFAAALTKLAGYDISRGAIGNWERGLGIDRENLKTLCSYSGKTMDWFEGGDTPPHLWTPNTATSKRLTIPEGSRTVTDGNGSGEPESNPNIVAVYSGGGVNVEKGFQPQIAAVLGLGLAAEADTIQIPLRGGSVMAVPVVGLWRVPEAVLRRYSVSSIANVHIVECVGNSMAPAIRSGDFVFIDLGQTIPHPEGIFAISEPAGIGLKQLAMVAAATDPPMVRIIPVNPQYPPETVPFDTIKVIGRYICRLTAD